MTATPIDQDGLLALWRGLYPRSYTAGIETEDGGSGFVVIQAMAAMFARVSEALAVSSQAYYLLPSSLAVRPWSAGASFATGTVRIARAAPAWADLVVPSGTRLQTLLRTSSGETVEGPDFETTADLVVASGDLGPWTVPIRSTRVGYQGNVPANRIAAFAPLGTFSVTGTATAPATLADNGQPDRFTIDLVGRYLRITSGPNASATPRRITSVSQTAGGVSVDVDGPALTSGAFVAEIEEWADLGLSVSQPTPTSGGVHGWLDAIGYDRGLFRQLGEADDAFRARIDQLSDVVSPAAISRLCERILTPLGIPWRIIEAGDPVVLSAYRWDPSIPGTGAGAFVTIDFANSTRIFAVALGPTGAGETGSNLDTYSDADPNALDFDAMTDGGPVVWLSALASLRASLDKVRAAGVAALILLDPAYF